MSNSTGITTDILQNKLSSAEALQPIHHVAIEDTTGGGSCGSKFAVLIVSNKFEGVPLLDRHRLVQKILEEEMKSIHALQIKAYTQAVYETKKNAGTL